jgi:hypothetical protein
MQQESRREDELQHGASAVLTYRAGANTLGSAVELGVDYQGQHNLQRRFAAVVRIPQGAPVRDQDFTFSVAGSYLQARFQPAAAIRLVAALRADSSGASSSIAWLASITSCTTSESSGSRS